MKINFVLPTVSLGGGTRVVVIYAQLLERFGHTVQIVYPPLKPIPFLQMVKSRLRGKALPEELVGKKSHLDGSGVNFKVLNCSRPVIDKDLPDADVVIATWWETAEWVSALSSRKGAKVYFVQGHETFSIPTRSRETYRLRMHKIVVSRWLQDLMWSEYGDQNAELVPNSVDHNQFFAPLRSKQIRPTVGMIYSTAPNKGVNVSLSVLKKVREHFPALRIVCFGSQSPQGETQLPKGAEFTLLPSQDSIREFYAQCDVWLTTSRSEGFNLPAMEAMACRTPVVATRTGWPVEAVTSGKNGMLENIDDVDGLAQGVSWILSQPNDVWKDLSLNAYATVAESSWATSAKLFERALEHARQRAKRGEIAGPTF